MRIFVSWSGEFSHRLASAIRQWLPKVLPTIDVFLSSEDIRKGSRWFNDIEAELEASDFGILCLTPDNVDAPWLLFEAGALSKKTGIARVCPLLLGLRPDHLQDPLRRFNAATTEKDDVLRLVRSANAAHGEQRIAADKLDEAFALHWNQLDSVVSELRMRVPEPDQLSPCPIHARGALPMMQQWEPALRAGEMLIIGQNLNLVLRQRPFFEHKLGEGAQIRLVIVDPRDDSLIEIMSRGVVEHQYTRRDFGPALDTIRDLRASLPNVEKSRLELRTIQYVPTLSFQVLDGDSPKGTILVELAPNRIAVPNRPHFVLRADNAAHREWYGQFLANCRVMHNEASPWPWD
jgi:hypothetical protein